MQQLRLLCSPGPTASVCLLQAATSLDVLYGVGVCTLQWEYFCIISDTVTLSGTSNAPFKVCLQIFASLAVVLGPICYALFSFALLASVMISLSLHENCETLLCSACSLSISWRCLLLAAFVLPFALLDQLNLDH